MQKRAQCATEFAAKKMKEAQGRELKINNYQLTAATVKAYSEADSDVAGHKSRTACIWALILLRGPT